MSWRTVALYSLRTRSDCALFLVLINLWLIITGPTFVSSPQWDRVPWCSPRRPSISESGRRARLGEPDPRVTTGLRKSGRGHVLGEPCRRQPSATLPPKRSQRQFRRFVPCVRLPLCPCRPVYDGRITDRMESVFPRKRWGLLNIDQSTGSVIALCAQNVSDGHNIAPNGYNLGR
jgi:hypothetical protein